jgi:two-component system osmolarity sensor histidine kinase EnvZ
MIKHILPRTLFGRSILIIVAPLVLLQVVSTWIFYDRHWDTVTNRMSWSVAGEIAFIVQSIRRQPGPETERWVADMARHFNMTVTLRRDEVLPNQPADDAFDSIAEVLAPALEKHLEKPFRIDTASYPNDVQVSVQLPEGVLSFVFSRKRVTSVTTYIFVLWMVGTSIVLFAVASVFMRNQVRPIRRLAIAVDAFGKGRDVGDFKPEGGTEIRRAAAAFNLMRARIQRSITQRTEMLAGVSHDLRTPLTRMKLQLAMLRGGPEVEELKSDVAEMERLVNSYLAFARGASGEETVETDVGALLNDVVTAARREGKAVELAVGDALTVPVRPDAFKRCLTNLVSNATQYGQHVAVTAARRNGAIEIVVDDDGPGIPPDRREDVFKPFFRLDEARNPDTGGTGLGLAIARDVVRGHGGDVTLEQAPAGGVRARVRLPV